MHRAWRTADHGLDKAHHRVRAVQRSELRADLVVCDRRHPRAHHQVANRQLPRRVLVVGDVRFGGAEPCLRGRGVCSRAREEARERSDALRSERSARPRDHVACGGQGQVIDRVACYVDTGCRKVARVAAAGG
eukprot:6888416-Prymnesium_polylepis.2